MRKYCIIMMINLFCIISPCFGWSIGGWNTGAHFLRDRGALFSYNSAEDVWKSNKPVSYGSDDSFIQFGDGGTKLQWDTTANAQLVLGTPVGTASGAGFFTLMTKDSIGTNSRIATDLTVNPTIRIYSGDDANADDFIEMYHDQSNGVFRSNGGGIKFISRSSAFYFYTGSTNATLGCILQTDIWKDQLVWHLSDETGNQIVICHSNGFDDYAHDPQTNPTIFIHSDTDVSSTGITNEWLSITHTKTEPFFNSGKGAFTFNRLELPQASPASPASDGEVQLDLTDGKMVVQWSSDHTALSESTDLVLGSIIKSISRTIIQPDQVASVSAKTPLMRIDATEFPHGIKIVGIYITKSDNTTSTTISLEKWDSPSDNSPVTLHTFSNITEQESNTLSPTVSTVEAGKIIMIGLDSADINYIQVKVEYYEPIS